MESRLSENKSLIYVLKPGDHNAGVDGDSINAGKLHSIAFIVQFATLTGNAVLKLHSGAANGTKTTSEAFRYRLAGAAQGAAAADTFGDWSASSAADGVTLTAATYANKSLIVEVDTDDLKSGQPWVTIEFSAAATALNAAVFAVGEPRYRAHDVPTVLA